MRRTLILAATVSLLAMVVPATHVAAAAPKKKLTAYSTELSSREVAVTTSTHRHLKLEISDLAMASATPNASQLSMILEAGHREFHDWSFVIGPHDRKINAATQAGRIRTRAKELGPYGNATIRVTPTSKPSTQTCNAGNTRLVTRHLKLTGSLQLATHSGGKGSWGTATVKHFRAGGSFVTQYGSMPCEPTTCATGIFWGAHGSGDASFFTEAEESSSGRLTEVLNADRLVDLKKPSAALRQDAVEANVPPASLSIKGGKPTLVQDSDGHGVSGSAVLVSPTAMTPKSSVCEKTHDESQVEWTDASYTNGDQPLTIKAQIEGKFTVPDQATGQEIGQSRQTD